MQPNYNNPPKRDLRVQKTELTLMASIQSLLNEGRFAKLTVDKICKEGQLSRATFYAHFTDKYDLLGVWLKTFWKYKANEADAYEDVRESINKFVGENKRIIKNLMTDADDQTMEIVLNFLCSVLNIDGTKYIDRKIVQKNIVVANLYVGGIIYYLLWQVKNNFPADVPMINDYSYGAIKKLWEWTKEN